MIPGAFGAEEPGEVGEGAQVPEGSLEEVGSERFSTHHTLEYSGLLFPFPNFYHPLKNNSSSFICSFI